MFINLSLSLIPPLLQEISKLLTENAKTLQWAEIQCKLLLCVIKTGSFQLGTACSLLCAQFSYNAQYQIGHNIINVLCEFSVSNLKLNTVYRYNITLNLLKTVMLQTQLKAFSNSSPLIRDQTSYNTQYHI